MAHEVVALDRGARLRRCSTRRTPSRPAREQVVGPVLDPAGGIGVGRTAVRRVVLEAAVAGRVVRRRDDDAVDRRRGCRAGSAARSRARPPASGCSCRGSSTSTVTSLATSTSSALCQAGSDRAWVSRPMSSGPVVPCIGPVLDDRLGGRPDVLLVERGVEARAAVARGAERDPLVGVARVGHEVVVRADDGVDVDQVFGLGELPGALVSHAVIIVHRSPGVDRARPPDGRYACLHRSADYLSSRIVSFLGTGLLSSRYLERGPEVAVVVRVEVVREGLRHRCDRGSRTVVRSPRCPQTATRSPDWRATPRRPPWSRPPEPRSSTVQLFDLEAMTAALDGFDAVCNLATNIPVGLSRAPPRRLEGQRPAADRGLARSSCRRPRRPACAGSCRRASRCCTPMAATSGSPRPARWRSPARSSRPRWPRATPPTSRAPSRVAVILRFGQLIGDDAMTRWRLAQARSGRAIGIGDPHGWAHVLHPEDAGTAVAAALLRPAGVYNVGAEPVRRDEMTHVFGEAVGRERPGFMSKLVVKLAGERLELLSRSQRVSSDRVPRGDGLEAAARLCSTRRG